MGENRLIVVSNRLPLTLRRAGAGWRAERSTGGLATALEPVMRRRHGIWLGWPGDPPDAPDPERSRTLAQWEEEHGLIAVDLPKAVAHHFYHGFSNGTLWPLFHEFPSRFEYSDRGWEAYVEANERFADAVVRRARPGDTVWVHDYHLMLVPQLLRKRSPDLAIGFFLHIPFPPSDVFRVLPNRGELLRGLLGADCIAFQTHRFVQHFRASLLRILGISSRMDGVEVGGRTAGLEAQPIGIHPEEFAGAVETDPGVARSMAELKRRFEGRRILLAVDRLDYTKGIPQRLRAYRRLLETVPETRRTVVLVQIAVPSRERIPLYSELREEVNRLVGEINGALSTPDWAPIVYIRRAVPRPELVALYASADVAWVAPLRDGMNLVAKEYVACKRGGDGALVLSEFAGAAAEMGEALLVNPYDEHLTVDAVARALAMPHEERRERMTALYRRVLRN
ncbi:MAG TPA: trehalose-6-phosphate synthase, partial [Vicinamibacteria bacterium]